jgi:YggT family protein
MGLFILAILQGLLTLAFWLIIIRAIVSWLVAFGVLNTRNPTVFRIVQGLERVTDPLLAPFQRFIPTLGGFDLSPVVALIVIMAARDYLLPWLFRPIIAALGG